MPEFCVDLSCGKMPRTLACLVANGCTAKRTHPRASVDVKNKRCEVAGCDKHPSHGRVGGQPLFCKARTVRSVVLITTRAHVVRQWDATSDQTSVLLGRNRVIAKSTVRLWATKMSEM